MEMTLNVKITGLENLVAVLGRFAAVSQAGALAMPAQEAQPTPVAPIALAAPAVTPVAPIIPVAVPVAQPTAPVAPTAVVPTTPQSYTQEQLALAASQLVDAGRIAEVQALVAAFGVQSLTALPQKQYGNFATQLRALGAKI